MFGKANVVKASLPAVKAMPKAMTNANVGKARPQKISSGKMAGNSKVTLGTTKHAPGAGTNVAHPIC
jgi:hypothetical protein